MHAPYPSDVHCLQVVFVDHSVALACQGYGVVRELESVATEASDKPTYDCFIKDCGELEANADLSPPQEVSPATFPLHQSDSPFAVHCNKLTLACSFLYLLPSSKTQTADCKSACWDVISLRTELA